MCVRWCDGDLVIDVRASRWMVDGRWCGVDVTFAFPFDSVWRATEDGSRRSSGDLTGEGRERGRGKRASARGKAGGASACRCSTTLARSTVNPDDTRQLTPRVNLGAYPVVVESQVKIR